MSERYDHHEDDYRARPQRAKSRPRTKDRPTHDDAVAGRVVTVDRGRYGCLVGGTPDQPGQGREVTAMTARELGRQGVVVGDLVGLVGDTTGTEGSLARIVRVEPRRTVLRRTADDADPVERVVVANADQLVVVTALADPPPRPRLVDRCLVAAYDAGLDPLLCLTKADLADPAPLLAAYAPLSVPAVVTGRRGGGRALDRGLGALRTRLRGRVSVLVGHSGVGKSTLVNALVPAAGRLTGEVNAVTGRGRHTSSSAVVLRLPDGGWVVDTPGVRSFGLAHVDPDRVVGAFPDLADAIAGCPRGCTHAGDAPDCALDEAAAAGRVDAARVESLRRLLAARDTPDAD